MKDKITTIILVGAVIAIAVSTGFSQIATGGSYGLNRAAVSNGGGNAAGGTYEVGGTSGQSAAGANGSGGTYASQGGFWFGMLAPTAASTQISGLIRSPDGEGLGNVMVSIAGGSLTTPRVTRTNQLGRFAFEQLEVGTFYIVTVSSPRYVFPQPSQVVFLDDVLEVFFTSN